MEQEPMQEQGSVSPWLLVALIVVILAAAGIIGWYFWGQNQTVPVATSTITPTVQATEPITSISPSASASPISTAGWKTFTDKTYDFSFKYPAADVVNSDKTDSDSNVYIRTSDEYWLYTITVAPNTADQTLAQVAKQNFDKLSASISSYMTSEAGTTPTFTQSDLNISGTPAKKMITTSKTGYSPSAEVVLIKNSNIITISPRAESDEFDTILSTFQFTK